MPVALSLVMLGANSVPLPATGNSAPPAKLLPGMGSRRSLKESWQSRQLHMLSSQLPRASRSDAGGGGGGELVTGSGTARMNIDTGKSTSITSTLFLIGLSVRR